VVPKKVIVRLATILAREEINKVGSFNFWARKFWRQNEIGKTTRNSNERGHQFSGRCVISRTESRPNTIFTVCFLFFRNSLFTVCQYAERCSALPRIILLNLIMLNGVLNVIMPRIIMLDVVLVNVFSAECCSA
jgi:hypothetical protein